ncbi:hypothetical protein FRC03_009475 [Tulasnella sp. 419]|nr:hypothetical protein FRC03_009475 [Tulasnella sp. 419]
MHYAAVGLLWAGWALLLLAMIAVITFAVVQTQRREGAIWNTPLADFKPKGSAPSASSRRPVRRPTIEAQDEEDEDYHPPTREQQQAVEAQIAAYRQGFYQSTPPRSNGGSQQHGSGSTVGQNHDTPRAGGASAIPGEAQRSQLSLHHPTGQRSQLSLQQPIMGQRSQQSLTQPVAAQRSQQSLRQAGVTFDLASPAPTTQVFRSLTPPSSSSHHASRSGTPVKTP